MFRVILAAAFAAAAALRLAAQAPPQTPLTANALVPVVGSVLGANEIKWKTDVELVNSGSTEATVAISLPTAPDQPMLLLTMAPASTQRFPDIAEAFGVDGALSPLLVQTMGRRSVTIRASAYGVRGVETFKPEPIQVAYGDTYYPVRYLQGLSFNEAYRTNIGLANLGDTEATFVLAAQRVPGRNLAVSRFTLPPNTLWHYSVQTLFPMISGGDDFSVLVESHAHNTYVYASVIENTTNEAHFINAVVAAPTQAP
jgi:hypothetical protein